MHKENEVLYTQIEYIEGSKIFYLFFKKKRKESVTLHTFFSVAL